MKIKGFAAKFARLAIVGFLLIICGLLYNRHLRMLTEAYSNTPPAWNTIYLGMERAHVHTRAGEPTLDSYPLKGDIWIQESENQDGRWRMLLTYDEQGRVASIWTRYLDGEPGRDTAYVLRSVHKE